MLRRITFKGGVHPPEEKKWTEHQPIENLPHPETVIIPLQQHIGAPAEPIVKKDDPVLTGQALAKTTTLVSVPCHASISGTVSAIEPRPHPIGTNILSIVIENDGGDKWMNDFKKKDDYLKLSDNAILNRIREAGIAGMGGAAFPTHVKLSPPSDKSIHTVILNGVECEPYLTADHRLMLEKPNAILEGLRIIMKILNVQRALVGIEKNKPDAIRLLQQQTAKDNTISILPLAVKYPQGAEKQLIKAATNLSVPSGGLPMDVGCLVHNVGTALAIYHAVAFKKPLIERVVTVTGSGVKEPKNLSVRIGTPFKHLIDYCGGYTENAAKLINGGPMMGIAQISDNVPVIKGTSGILVLDKKSACLKPQSPCISCAHCVDICPMRLLPNKIASYVEYNRINEAQINGLLDCIECGSCSYICPSKRNLVHYIQWGKALWNENQRAAG